MFIGNERQLLFIITRLQMKMLGQKMGLTVELNFFAFNGLNTEGINNEGINNEWSGNLMIKRLLTLKSS